MRTRITLTGILGDLFYIAVETLEGQHFEVTASVHGFFVNESSESRFQPQVAFIAGAYAHSIVTLMQQLSPKFCASYVKLVECMTSTSPLATATPSAPIAYPWLARPEALTSHINDHGCADFSTGFLAGSTIDSVNLRDYNEELQQARDMPRATGHEQISRDRKLQQVYADFLDAATRGAMAVVRGDLLPMNPYDTPRAHMFLYNNIFFSFALDGRDVFARVGGDEAARASFGKDLAATRAWNDVDAEGLYTPATAMIDFGGHRLVAQSMVPGMRGVY